MPKTRFSKVKRDPLKELFVGRKYTAGLSNADLGNMMNMSRRQVDYMLTKTSDDWTIREIRKMSRALDIPFEETKSLIEGNSL
jgi:hypothetical protein